MNWFARFYDLLIFDGFAFDSVAHGFIRENPDPTRIELAHIGPIYRHVDDAARCSRYAMHGRDDTPVRSRMREPAACAAAPEGVLVIHKCVERIYREEGLSVRRWKRKRAATVCSFLTEAAPSKPLLLRRGRQA